MEQKLKYDDMITTEIVYENYIEDKLEQDLLIPDYLCSARKVVRCEAWATITSKSLLQDKLVLDGICKWNVLYLSEEDELLHRVSCEKTFSEYFATDVSEGSVKYKLRVKNVQCKLQSPGRAECRASLCLAVKVTQNKKQKVLSASQEPMLQLLQNKKTVFEPFAESEKEIKIVGEILKKGKRECDIHSPSASIQIKECRCSEDKILVKGICKSKAVFISKEDMHAETAETETAFSQMFEFAGINENSFVSVTAEVKECDTSMVDEGGQEILLVNTSALLCLSVSNKREIVVVSDAYHPEYMLEINKTKMQYCADMFRLDVADKISHKVHLNTAGINIYCADLHGEIEKITVQDDLMVIEGKVTACFIYLLNGEVCCSSYPLPFQITKAMERKFEHLKCEAEIYVDDFNYIITGESEIEIGCSLKVLLNASLLESGEMIESVSITENSVEQVMSSPLVIYYGSKGEHLWEIGKKYCVPISVLKKNNEIEDDLLDKDKILFISKR